MLDQDVRFAQPKGLNTPIGYALARIEFINTAWHLPDGRFERLPASIQREYAREIERIRQCRGDVQPD